MDNVQNCDSYINITSSQSIESVNLLGSLGRRNVFPVRYGKTYRVELGYINIPSSQTYRT
jgi:hypothetical protein